MPLDAPTIDFSTTLMTLDRSRQPLLFSGPRRPRSLRRLSSKMLNWTHPSASGSIKIVSISLNVPSVESDPGVQARHCVQPSLAFRDPPSTRRRSTVEMAADRSSAPISPPPKVGSSLNLVLSRFPVLPSAHPRNYGNDEGSSPSRTTTTLLPYIRRLRTHRPPPLLIFPR